MSSSIFHFRIVFLLVLFSLYSLSDLELFNSFSAMFLCLHRFFNALNNFFLKDPYHIHKGKRKVLVSCFSYAAFLRACCGRRTGPALFLLNDSNFFLFCIIYFLTLCSDGLVMYRILWLRIIFSLALSTILKT